jgi:outer membrane lipoprotein SlyB
MNEASSAFVVNRQNRGLVMIGANGGAQYASRPKSYQRQRWQVTLKMDDGSARLVQQRYEPFVREGERVRIVGTQLELVE